MSEIGTEEQRFINLINTIDDVNTPLNNGLLPLVVAVKMNYTNAVKLLLEKGADPDLKLQKYKNIIDSMIQKQNENSFKKNYEEDMGFSVDENPDLEEELELYVKDTYN